MYAIEDGITQSLLATWVRCRQEAAYVLDGWESAAPKRALQVGSLMHEVVANWHGSGITKMPNHKWRKEAVQAGDDLAQVENDLAMVAALLPGYITQSRKKDKKRKWVDVERLFDVNWNGYRLRGRVDGLFQVGKKFWLLETKTTSRIDEEALKLALNFDFQSMFYTVAMHQYLGKPIAGVLYNLIRKPQLRCGKAETQPMFWKRVADDIIKRPDWYFVRFEVKFSKKQLAAFEQELDHKLFHFKKWVAGQSHTYKNESACRSRWNCSYLKACGTGCMDGYKQTKKLFSELD